MMDMCKESRLRCWQRRIFLIAWLTYGSFYLGRVNLSVALPAIQSQFGWSKAGIGLIGSTFFWVYALGQFINGQLGDYFPARIFVAVGMFISISLNLAFGFSDRLTTMILLWAVNGYVQSMGWGPIVHILSHWFSSQARARLSALFAPSYVMGHMGSWLLAGWLVSRYTWRAVFWAPAAIMVLPACAWLLGIRDHPRMVSLPSPDETTSLREGRLNPWRTIAHPQLRWAAVTCLFMGMAKDGLTLWGPAFLIETTGLELGHTAAIAALIPLCGLMGAFASGWLSGRYFHSQEAPVAALMLIALTAGISGLGFLAPRKELALVFIALGLIGFTSYGANSILLTALPLGLGDEGIVSSAAGFLDFASYLGAGISGALTGWLVDKVGWSAVFGYWVVAALTGVVILFPTLRVRSQR